MAEEQTAVISGNEAVSSISEGTADESEKAQAEGDIKTGEGIGDSGADIPGKNR